MMRAEALGRNLGIACDRSEYRKNYRQDGAHALCCMPSKSTSGDQTCHVAV
jgi:hypothetical protein